MSARPKPSASDPRHSAWVSANAGTGKTHTLADRVTRLLLDGADPARILCITYTKAAAAEMARRLFARLGEWAMLPDEDLTKKIAGIGAGTRDAEGLRAARRLFAAALEAPGGLKIQTIHAFCQNVLTRFPVEAGVPTGFDVLDERTSAELLTAARQRVLKRAAEGDEPLSSHVRTLAEGAGEMRIAEVLDGAVSGDRAKLAAFRDAHEKDAAAAFAAVFRAHGVAPGETPENVVDAFCEALRCEVPRVRAAAAWLSEGKKTDAARAAVLAHAAEHGIPAAHYGELKRAFLTEKDEPRASLVTKDHAAERPDLSGYLYELQQRFVEAEERRRAAGAAAITTAALGVTFAAMDEYGRLKALRGALDYADLIAKTRNLLERQAAAAWVLYKLDGGLDHILIDEAQDTSPDQWAIVRALSDEFFAGESARSHTPRTVFAVGDEKQSIFSFQGADPGEFGHNRTHFASRVKAAGQSFEDVSLDVSRRSTPEVLAFVDAVFANPGARAGVTFGDHAILHGAHRAGVPGRVEVWPAIPRQDMPDPDPWRPVDAPSVASPLSQLAQKIACEIRLWLDEKRILRARGRPIEPGDIMILLGKREPFASEIVRRLNDQGVPVAGADRLVLTEHIAVMDLIALGRFALLPGDDLNLAAVLRSPLIGLSEEELFELAHGRKGSLWSALSTRHHECTAFGEAYARLSDALARADHAPPYEFFAHMLGPLDGRRRLLARLGIQAEDPIEEFLNLALAHERRATPSLEGFLHWVERGGAEIRRDMEDRRDCVRIMTVHGAKGLQANIVILPDTTRVPRAGGKERGFLWSGGVPAFPVIKDRACNFTRSARATAEEHAMCEYRRLLYVALTRAADCLYIAGYEGRDGIKPESWYAFCADAAKRICTAEQRPDGIYYTLEGKGEIQPEADTISDGETGPMPPWLYTGPPPASPPVRLVRPSDVRDDEPPVFGPAENGERFVRGLLVHSLLAHLPDVVKHDRARVARRFLAARQVAEEEAEKIVADVLKVLDDPAFAALFEPGSRGEVPIVANLDELAPGTRVSGQIDRLALAGKTVFIADFKTNRTPPERIDDIPASYVAQLALYREAIRRIYPDKRAVCVLVWTEGPAAMEVPAARLDAEISRIRARLDHQGGRS